MSDPILVLQQVPHEGLGILHGAIRRAGAEVHPVATWQPDATVPASPDGFSGIIVLGGPMSVNQMDPFPALKAQLALLEQAVARDVPTLGICLGAQLLAATRNARIYAGDSPEIGWFSVNPSIESAADPLFADLPSPLPVFQWHGEGFDLPRGAVHLASSPQFPHQAFRLGRNVYGIQFHVEVEAPMIDLWQQANGAYLAQHAGQIDLDDLSKDAEARCRIINETGHTLAARWLALASANH